MGGFVKVSQEEVDNMSNAANYGGGKNPFSPKVRYLNMKPGNAYKLRVLPPFWDDKKYQTPFAAFALPVPQHYGVGQNAKETIPCTKNAAPRSKISCPLCEEFANGGKLQRSKLKYSYMMQVVLLNKVKDVDNFKEDGKTLIVYTIKVAKKSVFSVMQQYYNNVDRDVKEPFDLKDGCAVTITVTEEPVPMPDGSVKKMPNYNTQFNEASRGDMTNKIDLADLVDLRDFIAVLPTSNVVKECMEGLPMAEAVALHGYYDNVNNKIVKGTATSVNKAAMEADSTSVTDDPELPDSSEVEIVSEDVA